MNDQNPGMAPDNGYDPQDIQKNKTMAILSYFIFFLPLVACPDSKFGKYHANQSLVLLLANVALQIALGIISAVTFGIGAFLYIPLVILILVFFIMGIMNASKGEAKPLPLIGGFTIIKS